MMRVQQQSLERMIHPYSCHSYVQPNSAMRLGHDVEIVPLLLKVCMDEVEAAHSSILTQILVASVEY